MSKPTVHVHGSLDDLKVERVIHSNLKCDMRIFHAAKQHEKIIAHASFAALAKSDTTMDKMTTVAFQLHETVCVRLMYHAQDFAKRTGIHPFCQAE